MLRLLPLSRFILSPFCCLFLSFALEFARFLSPSLFALLLFFSSLLLVLFFPVAFYRSAPIIISTNSTPARARRPQTRGYFRERISALSHVASEILLRGGALTRAEILPIWQDERVSRCCVYSAAAVSDRRCTVRAAKMLQKLRATTLGPQRKGQSLAAFRASRLSLHNSNILRCPLGPFAQLNVQF